MASFTFGKVVTDQAFINRTEEIHRLQQSFLNQVNVILISPRRWGKTSLIKKVSQEELFPENYRFCFIDFFRLKSEEEFLTAFSSAVLKATTGKIDEWVNSASEFLKRFNPKFSMGADPLSQFDISFDLQEIKKDYSEILDLPEKICNQKNLRLIICLDEFQYLKKFEDPETFQNRLRSVWQHHSLVTYCIYGSKKHMLHDIFQNSKRPFYRFGDVMNLQPIETHHFVPYITRQFEKEEKEISPDLAEQLVHRVKNNSNYVQHLAHILFQKTKKIATEELLELSVNDLIDQSAALFHNETENLTKTQVNLLKAIANGVRSKFTSVQVLQDYKLGTPGNVHKILKMLRDHELIDDFDQDLDFADPVFELWFRERYMKV